ncbi:Serine/threonine-protein kinase TOUSLED [Forsythia ovata]|uniref:Serine/threonine-protein kinase TOUSLED n=1 Tax=Forsythia ovata TaxID=205694 RepID=A0ABD1T3W3_9LAMI
MAEDMLMHFSSNSSNQSDQSSLSSKMAKLEARMVGKEPSAVATQTKAQARAQPTSPPAPVKFGGPLDSLPESLVHSDDSDDDNGGEFLIQAKTQKRLKVKEHSGSTVFEHVQAAADTRQKIIETLDSNKVALNVNKRKQGCGRGNSASGRGRGSRVSDQTRNQTNSSSNSQLENSQAQAVSRAERQETRMKTRQDSLRLGNMGVIRAGTIISEGWEEGQALKDLNAHLRNLLEMKEAVERQRKYLKKLKGNGTESGAGVQEEDIIILDDIYKSRLASIKREEETVMRERDRYELDKASLIREMKRIRDEDGSRFNNFQILYHRYALLNLLGRGGFSEVYKAFDMVEHRYVACKLHGLNVQWSEDKKQSYIRHAVREYNIHKTLVNRHIVRLWDIFEIDQNTFCTVLEYCSGKDLDAVLKATPVLPEREARMIIFQIFQGLVYLNKRSHKIIHYDLKPGNILFDEFGIAKVTDFRP